MNTIQKTNFRLGITKNTVIATVSLLAALGIAYSFIQYYKITSLEKQIRSLDSSSKKVASKNSTLSRENANMKKAIQALQTEIKTEDEDMQISRPPVVEQASKMTVTKVDHQLITVPANEYHGPLSTDYLAVSVILTNQSESNQMYDTSIFSAITDSGVVVRVSSFGPGIEQTVWTRSELAPGGQTEVVLLFPSNQNLVTLNMTVPGSPTQQIATALPATS